MTEKIENLIAELNALYKTAKTEEEYKAAKAKGEEVKSDPSAEYAFRDDE